MSTTIDPVKIDIARSRIDRRWHIEEHFWIQDAVGLVRKLQPLKPSQLKLHNLLAHLRQQQTPVRIAILKARKTGLSTYIEADAYCEVRARGINALIIAHDLQTSGYIFGITKRFHDQYDLPKPLLRRANMRELVFSNAEGSILVDTAGNIKAGTGLTPQYIHASESSKWQHGITVATALLQSVTYAAGTTVIHESTAYGEDPYFFHLWKGAADHSRLTFDADFKPTFEVFDQDKWNGYVPLFISVFDDPACNRAFVDADERAHFATTLDEYEEFLIKTQNATFEYLNYRRWTIKNQHAGSVDLYNQEHPERPEVAFLTSGRPRFDNDALLRMPLENGERGELRFSARFQQWDRKVEFWKDRGGLLTRFRAPVKGHRYVIGVDTAEGLLDEDRGQREPDASVAVVLDLDNGGEQVATYCGQVAPEYMIAPVAMLGEYYNWAFLIPESNSTGSHLCKELAKSYPAEKLFRGFDFGNGRRGEVGWRTTITTRNILIGQLADYISQHELLHDSRTVEECRRFVWSKHGRVEAGPGAHDDHCFALGLAIVGMEHYPKTQAISAAPAAQRKRPAHFDGYDEV